MPVLGLTIDERDVFWTEEGEPFRAIRAAPKVGGVVRTLAEGRENPTQIISHGEFVYWLENTIRGGVVRARKDGTGLTRLPLPSPFSFAVNGGVVTSTSLETNTVERWSASSGPERIAWGQGAPQGIFVQPGATWWVNYSGGQVQRLASDATVEETFARSTPGVRQVVVDCHAAYWTSDERGGVVRAALLAGGPPVDLACGPGRIAIDAAYLYLDSYQAVRIPLEGGPPEPMGSGTSYFGRGSATTIEVDETAVYWAADGGIMRATK